MSSIVSSRRKRFYELLRFANDQPSSWLANVLKHPERPRLGPVPALSRLACLRILACRHSSGQPYFTRKKAVRLELGI